ncbi:MAG: phytoene desaturase [Bacteroidia bacterium]|nr:phytoene desaturase [Bacteroidia bacterium]MBP7261467.1 phytoene desaturase [Bacteroidia bacterium]MBP9181050.1 phytoene desaturase [Bacteroidia bacterium]MBP9724780.1 phytoene desaturase [Bacteroidia bacterium]
MNKKRVVVIGAGFAGLSTACYLAKAGYRVTVLEKNDSAGGRARVFESNGFVFDMGPSWYWMPDVFEKFFADFGKKVNDYYQLLRLDPSYRVVFSKNDVWDIPADYSAFRNMLDAIEPGAAVKCDAFLKEAAYKYDVGVNDLVYRPSQSLIEFFDWRLAKGVFRLDVFTSMSKHIRKYFKDPRIIELMEFPVLFLGATPQNTPALYSLMNFADIKLGTWYPMGGMHSIIKAMHSLAIELGVNFIFGEAAKGFDITGKDVVSLRTNTNKLNADAVVASADYHHIDQQLLPKEYSNYTPEYWDSRVMAPSSLIFYLGVDRKLNNLQHHNLFFDEDFTQHAHQIYEDPAWPDKPLFYVSCPSKTDPTVAPEGMENLFVLVPVAPELHDSEEIREKYYHMVMERLEALTEQNIRQHVIYKRSYAHNNFVQDYHSFKGNAYGLANTLKQTAILKPSLKNKKLNNLFYSGQLTVPGPGVPPSIISGKVVAQQVHQMFNQ